MKDGLIIKNVPGSGGGGSSPLLEAVINLNATQILDSFNAPFEVIPAPGAGKIIVVVAASVSVTNGAVIFGQIGSQASQLTWNSGGVEIANAPVGIFRSGQLGYYTVVQNNIINKTPVTNKNVAFYAPAYAGPIAVASLGSATGAGYVVGDTGLIDGNGSGAQYVVDSTSPLGGSGYAVGDTGTLDLGNADAEYVVNTVGSGAVLTYTITNAGTGYSEGNSSTTSGGAQPGSGSGFNILITAVGGGGDITSSALSKTVATFHLTSTGSNYEETPDVNTEILTGRGDGTLLINVDQITDPNGTANLYILYYIVTA